MCNFLGYCGYYIQRNERNYFVKRGSFVTLVNNKMLSLIIRFVFFFLVINHLFTPCEALRGNSYNSGNGKGYNDPSKPKTYGGLSPGLPSQNTTRRGLGISAWGIVTVIVSMILAGMGFYYFSICYPILCKKTRKYDMIGLPPSVV